MMWPDIIIAFANILLGYALIPQVYKGFKEKKAHIVIQTGFLTTIGLYAIGISLLTLELFLSAAVTLFNGTMWLILFIQSIVYK